MCLNDNRATLSSRYLNAQLSSMWENAVECVGTEPVASSVNMRSHDYDRHKYTRSLAQFLYAGKRTPREAISKDSLFFYGIFGQPRLEFICNHEVALFLHLNGGHFNKEYPTNHNISGFKANMQDNVVLEGLEVAFRLKFSRRILDVNDSKISKGASGHQVQLTILDFSSAKIVLFDAKELGRETSSAIAWYLKKYLEFLQQAGHHVLFDLPDFDKDLYRHNIDYSLVSRALEQKELCTDVTLFGTSTTAINQYLKTAWSDIVARYFTDRRPSDPLTSCIYEIRSDWLSGVEGHFHIKFHPPTIRPLCDTEVVLYFTASDIHFFDSADFDVKPIHSFTGWTFAFVLNVIQDKSNEVTLLKLDLGSARFVEHYSSIVEFGDEFQIRFFNQIVKALTDEYLSLLVQYNFHIIFSPHAGFGDEPEFSSISEDEAEWTVGVSEGLAHSGAVMWADSVRKISLFGFDHVLAISEEAINKLFSSLHFQYTQESSRTKTWTVTEEDKYTVKFDHFKYTRDCIRTWIFWEKEEEKFTVDFSPIKVKLLSNGNALVIINIESGKMKLKNGKGTYEIQDWTVAYEVGIKMIKQTEIVWPENVRERYNKSPVCQLPGVRVVEHIILNFDNAVYIGRLSQMDGMWDSDTRSAVHRLESILHYMSFYLKALSASGHNVIHSIPIMPEGEQFGLTSVTYQVLSKDNTTISNCLFRRDGPVIMVFGMTCGRAWPNDINLVWGKGWVFPRSHGTLCLSKATFLEGRLLPQLSIINAKTTVVPRFPEVNEEEWKVYLTTWDQHRYRKSKSCNWTLLDGNADWLEYGWEHRDEWSYKHEGTREEVGGFSVLCHTKNQLILPTTYRANCMEIKLTGESVLRLKDVNKDRTKKTVAKWSAVIQVKTEPTGLRVILQQRAAPIFERTETTGIWTIDTDSMLREQLPDVIDIDGVLAELKQSLEGSWKWSSAALGTYNLASPVFTKTGDLIVQLRFAALAASASLEIAQSVTTNCPANVKDNVASTPALLEPPSAISVAAVGMDRSLSNLTELSGINSALATPNGSDNGRQLDAVEVATGSPESADHVLPGTLAPKVPETGLAQPRIVVSFEQDELEQQPDEGLAGF